MCNTRKRITLNNNDIFYLCSCADSRITHGTNNHISKVKINQATFTALQQGNASVFRIITKAPHDCYDFSLKSNSYPSENTPLLEEKSYFISKIQALPVSQQATSGLFSMQKTPSNKSGQDASENFTINFQRL